jgi:uncharacterized protein
VWSGTGRSRLAELTPADREELLDLALAAVRSGLLRQPIDGLALPTSPALDELGASFVTLERDRALLGCIGTIEPVRPLYEDVMQNAYRSAFADPRLPSVTVDDFVAMDVEVSVLSALEELDVTSRAECLVAVRPGIDGILFADGPRRATFLPAVWPKVSSPEEFVDLLLAKGGWSRHGWPPGLRVWRYTTDEFWRRGPRTLAVGA